MLTILTTHPLNTHFIWLRLAWDMSKKSENNPNIKLTDYLNLTADTCSLRGMVMRMQESPWRIDVLCYREQGDCLTTAWKTVLPEHTAVHVNVEVWPAPSCIKPTIVLADDSHGLAAVSLLCQWRHRLPSHLLLWQTQGFLPFALGPSKIYTPLLPPDMIATMRECEDLGIVLRVLQHEDRPGCFHGDMAELLKQCPALLMWHTERL